MTYCSVQNMVNGFSRFKDTKEDPKRGGYGHSMSLLMRVRLPIHLHRNYLTNYNRPA